MKSFGTLKKIFLKNTFKFSFLIDALKRCQRIFAIAQPYNRNKLQEHEQRATKRLDIDLKKK